MDKVRNMGEEPLKCFKWTKDSHLECRRTQIKQEIKSNQQEIKSYKSTRKKTVTSIEKWAKDIIRQFTENKFKKLTSHK